MISQELYLQKQKAIASRRKFASHGNSYDNTATVCFAFTLLAIAIAASSFILMIVMPENFSQFILGIAYVSAAIVILFTVIAIISRILYKKSRKPLLEEKQQAIRDYEQAIRETLKSEFGLAPADDASFSKNVSGDILGENDALIIEAVNLDNNEKINLTLKECDNDSLIFTRHGLPYTPDLASKPETLNEVPYQYDLGTIPGKYEGTRIDPETVPKDVERPQANIQTL